MTYRPSGTRYIKTTSYYDVTTVCDESGVNERELSRTDTRTSTTTVYSIGSDEGTTVTVRSSDLYRFYAWKADGSNVNWVTRQSTVTASMLPSSGTELYFRAVYGLDSSLKTVTVNYWLQQIAGEDYTGQTTTAYNGKQYVLSEESQTARISSSSNFTAKSLVGFGDALSPYGNGSGNVYNFYYPRNVYTLCFVNGGTETLLTNVAYHTNLSSYDTVPQKPTGYSEQHTFEGWYTDEKFPHGAEFDFATAMPDHDLRLYAYWASPIHTVHFSYNYDTDENGVVTDSITVSEGESIPAIDPPEREGYLFVGWATASGQPFSFENVISSDLDLYAQWRAIHHHKTIVYSPGDGAGDVGCEPLTYAVGESAIVLFMPESWLAPSNKDGFVCWNYDGRDYYPGQSFPMPDSDVTLTAQWAERRTATLTFDYNDDSTPPDVVLFGNDTQVPNSLYPLPPDPTREGYQFRGWNTKKTGGGKTVKYGDSIRVDTVGGENNVLYAQWILAIDVKVSNTVGGAMGSRIKPFEYTLIVEESGVVVTTSVFTLKNNESLVFGVLQGQNVTLRQTDYGDEGYETAWRLNDLQTGACECNFIADAYSEICFTNHCSDISPTAFVSVRRPYIALLSVGAALFVACLCHTLTARLIQRNLPKNKNGKK